MIHFFYRSGNGVLCTFGVQIIRKMRRTHETLYAGQHARPQNGTQGAIAERVPQIKTHPPAAPFPKNKEAEEFLGFSVIAI
mgnify:FL=1